MCIFEDLVEFCSFYNSYVLCIVKFTGHLLSDRDTTSSTRMGAGGNGNNRREWEGNGNKARLNLGFGMEMGMNHREWEGMGLKKTFPLISIHNVALPIFWLNFMLNSAHFASWKQHAMSFKRRSSLMIIFSIYIHFKLQTNLVNAYGVMAGVLIGSLVTLSPLYWQLICPC